MKFIWNIFIHLHIKKQTHSCPNPEIQYCGIHAIHSTDLLQLLITKSSRLSPSSSWSLKWKMKHPLCYWVGVIHWSQHKSETWSMDYIQALKHWELSNLQSVLLLIQLSYGHINSPGLLGFSITPSIIDWPPLLTHSKLLIPQSFSPLYPSCLFFHPSGHMWQLPGLSAPWTAVGGIGRAGKQQPSCFVEDSGATAADGSQKKQVTKVPNLKELNTQGLANQLGWTNFLLQGTMQSENTSVCPFCTITASAETTKWFGFFFFPFKILF